MRYCVTFWCGFAGIFILYLWYCGFTRLGSVQFLPIWEISMQFCGILLFYCAVLRFSDPTYILPPRPRRIARNWMRTDFNKRDRVSAQLSLWSSPSLVVKPHLLPPSETCAIGCALTSTIVAECLLNCLFYLHHHLW